MNLRSVLLAAAAVVAGSTLTASLAAAEDVKIGAIFPMSGPNAQIGLDSVAAIRTAIEIVNDGPAVPMKLAGKGLPGLKGGKVSVVVGDNQAKPEIGQGEAERMITQDKVSALLGTYFSAVTVAASQAAERAGIPFVCGVSTSPALTKRGFKYFFRTTPSDEHFSKLMFDFMKDYGAKTGHKVETVAILHEDTAFGADAARVQEALAKEYGMKVVEKIAYRAQTTSLTSEIQRLKAANPDVLLPTSYTSDAFLTLRTAKDLDYNPKMVIANAAGYTDPSFLSTMGSNADAVMSRSPYNDDLAKRIPLIGKVNEIFKKHSGGRDISDVSAREFTAAITLLDAINRAGSGDPEKIRDALAKTDIGPDQLIVPFSGVKFGADGQNELTRSLIMQVQGGKFCTVYPFDVASCDVKPMSKWADKK